MKTLASFLLTIAFCFPVSAQDCGYLDDLNIGDSWTFSAFNSKGEKESDAHYQVSSKDQGDTLKLGMDVVSVYKDDTISGGYEMNCANGQMFLSLDHLVGDMLDNMDGMEVDLQSDQLSIPVKLNIGDTLEPATISMEASMRGITMMKITTTIKDRVVIGAQEVTTSAGTFDCYVIEQTMEVSFGRRSRISKSKDYFSVTHGTIRSENYSKKGKLMDYAEVTAISF